MDMRHLTILPIIALLILPTLASAATLNAGFVQGLWFSKYPVLAGEAVRIYAALQNRSGQNLAGEVIFYIDETVVERQAFTAHDGRLVEASTDWLAKAGPHKMRAELANLLGPGGVKVEAQALTAGSVAQSEITVDLDNDQDGQGDSADEDDDNDGASDRLENAAGTNPLNAGSVPTVGAMQTAGQNIINSITQGAASVLWPVTPSFIAMPVATANKIIQDTVKNLENLRLDLKAASQGQSGETPLLKEELESIGSTVPLVKVPTEILPQRGPWLALAADVLGVIVDFLRAWWIWVVALLAVFVTRFLLRRKARGRQKFRGI